MPGSGGEVAACSAQLRGGSLDKDLEEITDGVVEKSAGRELEVERTGGERTDSLRWKHEQAPCGLE